MKIRPVETRFWEKVKISEDDKCWEWLAGKFKDGYGVFWFQNHTIRAHRFSWKLHYGYLSDDVLVLHKCDNPICVNPNHLFIGSHQDNMRDKHQKGHTAKGEKCGRSKLTLRQINEIRKLYSKGKRTQQSLSEQFGITQTQISNIVRFYSWK